MKIFKRNSSLSRLERLVLDSIAGRLPVSERELWSLQVSKINKVQRLPQGVEVNFYRISRGRPTFDDEIAFKNRTQELMVASLVIKACNQELAAKVWCVRGFIFSIEYEGAPAFFDEILYSDEVITDVRISLHENLSASII
ncbi:hypothetical protein LN565_04130 [Xanthomonas euvesicatoria pv. euvesicatoria]|uniref:hypothetical protein n=1 Tax=Xanthomonas TaxID=338 RepID=UPI000F8F34B6|nr:MULTISPECIES: hypothetical protein [Xanthomonas]MBV6888340.1 hypothetical protein [Xanthomonas campestris pv. spermacoces]MBO9857260.1 hypothetical protein [Xanthomonas sp. A1809]MCC8540211.1 hypothetical protein [Xanthomonas euvesicatoria pv. euvesicatoria]MCC8739610.1 hypothetical protein [Xanthomonas euvesicatoria pv. euvesicatoria]MCC8757012.1 hypothetical protein [Xanthomonas euvesicatoria pv. euvesicatoria]